MIAAEPADRVVVVGAGVAGLTAALELAPLPVTLVVRATLSEGGSTAWAQGGIAAAIATGDDPQAHARDTLAVAGGLADPAVVEAVTAAAPAAVDGLASLGVRFDRNADGTPALALEGGHGAARVLHAGGDRSGSVIREALLAAVRARPHVTVRERTHAEELITRNGRVVGVALRRDGRVTRLAARAVVLATGGYAGLWAATTNPLGNWGGGLALAARAGAVLRDLEFVQFHPTAIAAGTDPLPLASEALRGAGARLVDAAGAPITAGIAGGDLAPRDRVAAAVFHRRARGEAVYLDAASALGAEVERAFATVARHARAAGIDPTREPIPVRPAAHYTMGGVRADLCGRTSLAGLHAVGEVAATGLHGANRLASNSLLEGVVTARRAAAAIRDDPKPAGTRLASRRTPRAIEPPADPASAREIRQILDQDVGVVRDATGLARAVERLAGIAARRRGEVQRRAEVALMVAWAASRRRESRGAHQRTDHPHAAGGGRHQDLTWAELRRALDLRVAAPGCVEEA